MTTVAVGFFAPNGPSDPEFSNVVLLLHGDGADGSTTIVDNGPLALTPATVGDVVISTAQSVFGGASLRLPKDDPLSYASNSAFDLSPGDFTIEMWARELNTSDGSLLCRRLPSTASGWVVTASGLRAKINGSWS